MNRIRLHKAQFTPILFGVAFVCLVAGMIFFSGCEKEAPVHDDVVASVGGTSLNLPEFNEFFDLAEAGFSGYGLGYTPNRKETRKLFLNQLVEELFVLEHARVHGIVLDPEALQEAEQQIWQDYSFVNEEYINQGIIAESPDEAPVDNKPGVVEQNLQEPPDSFRQVLQDQALSYKAWRKGLARRLLIEETISGEVGERVQVSEEEIDAYLAGHPVIPQRRPEEEIAYSEEGAGPASDKELQDKEIVSEEHREMARRVLEVQKAQEIYAEWLMELKEQYPVRIRPELL
ncbi:MAG: SurA N-terminal domain-containing protein [Desulfatibacillum sp.]|nr:SurA N-terminal domain-containing protein [Desulfatibacillum sp.]